MHQAVTPQWSDAPEVPSLNRQCIDVWRIRLDSADGTPLTAPRTQAAEAMRQILARYLLRPPDSLDFARHPGGKPYLIADDHPLEFNLSHTRGIALLAVSRGRPVGVDVEPIRRLADPLRLARRVMDDESVACLERASDPDRRRHLFIDLWTRLEARQKSHGRGIFAPAVAGGRVQSFGFGIDDRWQGCVATAAPPDRVEPRFYRLEVP